MLRLSIFLYAYFCSQFCRPRTLDPSKVNGKVVACDREGRTSSVAEGQEALSAGAVGVIMRNQPEVDGKTLLSEPHVVSTINYYSGRSDTTPKGSEITPQ
jgi:hypothetical protein